MFTRFPITLADNHFNSTTDTNKVVCIAPLSGSYGLLQRTNFYAILVFVVYYRHKTALVDGAAGALMVLSGIAAIHAIALACFITKNRAVFDMDIVGTWALLGTTTTFLSLFLQWSTVLRQSKARPIVQCWGVLVSCGMICSWVNLSRTYEVSYPCVDTRTNSILTSVPPQLPGFQERFNCTPSCFESPRMFRSQDELIVANMSRVFDKSYFRMEWVGVMIAIAGIFGLLSCLSGDSDKTPLERQRLQNKDQLRARARSGYPHKPHWSFWRPLLTMASPIICTTAIVCNEMYLLHLPRLPMGESPYAVGQWSGWVATALVLMATLFGIHFGNGKATSESVTTAESVVDASLTTPPTVYLQGQRRQTTMDFLQADLGDREGPGR